jgi:hypothetical protein
MQEQFTEPRGQDPKERNLPTGQAGPESNPEALGWKRWLNYQSVVKQVPFFLFLAMLAVVYIYNGHYADKTIRNINRTEKEVKELKYEYIAVKSEVMFQSKPSELVKAVEPLGLKELVLSPVVLKDSTEKN